MAGKTPALGPEKRTLLSHHTVRWNDAKWRTGPADRATFEAAMRRCHELAGIPWHGNVVWAGSPSVVAFAGPVAELLIAWAREGRMDDVQAALACEALTGPARETVLAAMRGAPPWAEHAWSTDALIGLLYRRVCVPLLSDGARSWGPGVQAVLRDEAFRGAAADPRPEALEAAMDALTRQRGALPATGWVEIALRDAFDPALGHDLRQFVAGRMVGLALCTSFCREVWGLAPAAVLEERALVYEQLVQGAWCWHPHPDFLLVSEHPLEIHLEAAQSGARQPAQRLHRSDGPAMVWPDGWSIHALHGVRVPGWVVEQPETINAAAIERETNAEVRRIMLDRYGWPRFMADSGATVVESMPMDCEIAGLRGARLLRKDLPGEPEPLVYLEMVNSTPEPDGTHRRYLERIDPRAYRGAAARRCQAAMASRWRHRDENGRLQLTFERWWDYRPTAES